MLHLDSIKDWLLTAVDLTMSAIPQPKPSDELLRRLKIIAHRGCCENGAIENTLEAFAEAEKAGAWGIEFDVRWTEDDIPVVHHDQDAKRTFNKPIVLDEIRFENLRREIPEIPTLKEVIDRFSGNLHLFIEVKSEKRGWSEARWEILKGHLSQINPGEDYHIMSLKAELLTSCHFVPPGARLPVAEFNIRAMSELSLRQNFAGLTGQYLMLTNSLAQQHHSAGQKAGTGFATSKNLLYREVNRGIDWIFTNHALKLSQYQIRD
jgi:glycerophosphoryl diester phosphodiesterase